MIFSRSKTPDSQLFKIQRSIATSEKYEQFLIYNRDESVTKRGDIGQNLREIMGDRLKIYAYCRIKKDGELCIGQVIEDQDW